MQKLIVSNLFLLVAFFSGFAQTKLLDELECGNDKSETNHHFYEKNSKVLTGGLGEQARVLMPVKNERVEGGSIFFTMKVSPVEQNYVTFRFWGSDSGNKNILVLFCEGRQVGYRHLGDYDMISISNGEAPFPGRFIYTTLPLPLSITKGKSEIELSLRSTGPIFRYGETFDKYQGPMVQPSKSIYKVYTHTGGYFNIPKTEKQSEKISDPPIRKAPGEEVLELVKETVNKELLKYLAKDIPAQGELQLLADAYFTDWTSVYHNNAIVQKVLIAADGYYDSSLKEGGAKIYQDSWVTTGPLCIAINRFIPQIGSKLDEKLNNGKTRREAWSELFKTCVDYAKTHRRQYTNQSMIVDLFLYEVNETLAKLDPAKALPRQQTLKYLYESVGLLPWLGSETGNGQERPLGDNYFQLTEKGLTKELGFVGGYGEILHWVLLIYEATGERGKPGSGDPRIKEQLLKMMNTRSYFRYPSVDAEGYKTMRAEAVIGWRDPEPYPGYIVYGEKGSTRETTPLMTAAATLDPKAVAYVQQMLNDNQLFAVVNDKMKDRGINSMQSLFRIPEEYAIIKKQSQQNGKLPMTQGMPDFVFSDEEDGVVAIKNKGEILYASLYWRANYAINYLARVHYTTPNSDHIATVFEDVQYTPSGLTYKRPERVNLYFSDARNFYPDVKSAHTGEELPIAKVPDGISFQPGSENVYAGKGDFYTLRYGKYLIGMNCTKDRTFILDVPANSKQVIDLTAAGKTIAIQKIEVKPRKTVILEIK